MIGALVTLSLICVIPGLIAVALAAVEPDATFLAAGRRRDATVLRLTGASLLGLGAPALAWSWFAVRRHRSTVGATSDGSLLHRWWASLAGLPATVGDLRALERRQRWGDAPPFRTPPHAVIGTVHVAATPGERDLPPGTVAIHLEPASRAAAAHLRPGAAVWVLTWQRRQGQPVGRRSGARARDGVPPGAFTTRSALRPVPIGLDLVTVGELRGHVLRVAGAALPDGAPVIDIKPYDARRDVPGSRPATDDAGQPSASRTLARVGGDAGRGAPPA